MAIRKYIYFLFFGRTIPGFRSLYFFLRLVVVTSVVVVVAKVVVVIAVVVVGLVGAFFPPVSLPSVRGRYIGVRGKGMGRDVKGEVGDVPRQMCLNEEGWKMDQSDVWVEL